MTPLHGDQESAGEEGAAKTSYTLQNHFPSDPLPPVRPSIQFLPPLISLFNYESMNRLIHWLGQCPRDPIISPNPYFWTLYQTLNKMILFWRYFIAKQKKLGCESLWCWWLRLPCTLRGLWWIHFNQLTLRGVSPFWGTSKTQSHITYKI
jgi:hypothetical protein